MPARKIGCLSHPLDASRLLVGFEEEAGSRERGAAKTEYGGPRSEVRSPRSEQLLNRLNFSTSQLPRSLV